MLTNRLRLYIIYFLIGVSVVAGCIGVAAKFETARMKLDVAAHERKLDAADAEVRQLKEDRARQDGVLTALQLARETDGTLIKSLSGDMERLGLRHLSAMDKITQLERSNEKVLQFLDSPVPPDGCVLDNSCGARTRAPGNDQAAPQSGPAAEVPAAGGVPR